jgi:hypothetical protein
MRALYNLYLILPFSVTEDVYATRSLRGYKEAIIRFRIRVVLALVSSTLRDTSFDILHLVFP